MNEEAGINIENLGDVRWHLCLCLVLAWMFVILFVSRGIQSTGKVVKARIPRRRHRHRHGHPRDDPREDFGEDVGVGVGVGLSLIHI